MYLSHLIRVLVLAITALCTSVVQPAEFFGLGQLQDDTESSATAVSNDGAVVVGWSGVASAPNDIDPRKQAFHWTAVDGMVGLGSLSYRESRAHGVSDDGTVVVGTCYTEMYGTPKPSYSSQAFRWTAADGMEGLGHLPDDSHSGAGGVSADGKVVVGVSDRWSYTGQAFHWTQASGMVGLGTLPGGIWSRANGVSADGTVVVGSAGSDMGSQAFRWSEARGMESIEHLLFFSIGLTDWQLQNAFGTSKDGSVIVGRSINPDGHPEAWIADLGDIPPLPTNSIDISGTVKTANGVDICALVLASGQFTFSCDPPGEYTLSNVPRDFNRMVKRQIYADGFIPKIDILTDSIEEAVVMTRSGICPNYNIPYEPAFVPDSAGITIYIAGQILLQNSQTPICAMVLANGQYMFSCDGTGSYLLKIPLDNNGQFKLQVYADGFAPSIRTFDEFKTTNIVRMARAAECQ